MGLFHIFKRNKKQEELNKDVQLVEEQHSTTDKNNMSSLGVLLEKMSSICGLDVNSLTEITDSQILTQIDSVILAVGEIKNTANTVIEEIKDTYRMVFKKGTQAASFNKMTKTKKISEKMADKSVLSANISSTVMAVAPMVVVQYYMNQVCTRLDLINESISKVIDFLDVQYKSRVASLMELVYNISKYQISSIENEELRGRELDNVQRLRDVCQTLLNQAETTLETLTCKNCPTFDNYEKTINEIGKWTQYQTVLVKLLYQINILDFALHLGIKSKEQCFGSFDLHASKAESIHTRLIDWHNAQCEALKIDLTEGRRKHTGALAWLNKPIGWINDNWNYQSIDDKTVHMIKDQISEITNLSYSSENLFNEDVQIIIKDGKYYYLP